MSKVSTRPQKSATAAPVKDSSTDPNSVFYVAPGAKARPKIEQPPVESESATLIVLMIKPKAERFTGNTYVAAQDSGFDTDRKWHRQALVTRDTRDTIAHLEINGFDQAMGQLREIRICCDPEACAVEFSAGPRLETAMLAFAQKIDGYVTDGLGKQLTREEITAVCTHIERTIQRRSIEAAPVGVKVGPYTTRFPGTLSFQYCDVVEVGRKKPVIRNVRFPTARVNYYAGQVEGMRRAQELMNFILEHRVSNAGLLPTLAEIFTSGEWESMHDGSTKEGNIARGFLTIIETIFRQGCATLEGSKWLTNRIAYMEKQAAEEAEADAIYREEFVERMRAAKAAKKAKRAAS